SPGGPWPGGAGFARVVAWLEAGAGGRDRASAAAEAGVAMRTWRAAAARVGYLLVLAVATLSALQLDADPAAVTERLRRMLVPSISARDAIDGARNLVLFAGWGLVWVLTARRPRWWVTVAAATVTGAVLSLSVELVQAFSRTRRASILDLMTNS